MQLEKAPQPDIAAVGRILTNERTSQPTDQQTVSLRGRRRCVLGFMKYPAVIPCGQAWQTAGVASAERQPQGWISVMFSMHW